MAPPSDDDHACGWRDEALELRARVERLSAEFEALKRQVHGRKSEKMPPLDREVRRGKEADPAEAQRKRRERAIAKEKLVTERVTLSVHEDERQCPHCQRRDLKPVGNGKESTVFEYVPGYFRRRIYVRETQACSCGEYIVTAPCADKTTDKTRYAPSFIAHLIVAKCSDSIPLYRLEKQYQRVGIPIARSTMTDLFHRNAEVLAPLVELLLKRIAGSDIVLADETSIRLQRTTKRGYLWAFIAGRDIAYVFSPDRSGKTPSTILGSSKGTLLVDAYTGYNKVTAPDGRTRAGCLAHARRKLFEAKDAAPEAQTALDLIRDIYVVEHNAKAQDIVGTDAHLALRQTRTRPLLAQLFRLLRGQRDRHPPKSPMGKAVRYALNNHRALTRFTCNPRIPPDNNRSEAALRVVALGRKNFLFVGSEDAGDNIAGLYSLVATCEAHGKNPLAYLTDVLTRIGSHPKIRLDELLPDRWQPAAA
ncbi:MAG: IS66 family transposase [Solirubrobacteraceae bacterium]